MSDVLKRLSADGYQPGLVMVKPHAYDQVLDPVVSSILRSGHLADKLSADDPLLTYLSRIIVKSPVLRDLRKVDYGKRLLDLFYNDKNQSRYYPLIQHFYLGKVAFIPFLFQGSKHEFNEVPNSIKGVAESFDKLGNQVHKPYGIRGILCPPYEFIDKQTSLGLAESDYENYFTPVVNNCIHVCDNGTEIDFAYSSILGDAEIYEKFKDLVSPIAYTK